MRYALTGIAIESKVTQTLPQRRKAERRALKETNRYYQRLEDANDYAEGFIHGLVIGALSVAVLAVLVLGWVISGP